MKTIDRAKANPAIGHSTERRIDDRRRKDESKTQAGTEICSLCRAVGMHKRWFVDSKLYEHFAADPTVRLVECPGCQRVSNKVYEGEVNLASPLLESNHNMIYGTLYHAAARAFMHNPLSRIAIIEDEGDKIRIVTTTCSLAERLGKAIHKALKGNLRIKAAKDERFVFVNWTRPH